MVSAWETARFSACAQQTSRTRGSAIIAAVLEFLYPIIGRTQEPSLRSLGIGFFVVAGTASSLHVVMRDLENWL
jgi:hypothetical protein